MKIFRPNIYEFSYLLFAFDSALKLNLGSFRIQAGIFFSFLLLAVYFVVKPEKIRVNVFLKENWSLLPFIIYFFIHVLFFGKYSGTLILVLYYLIGILIFYFFYSHSSKISSTAVRYFQYLLVVSGIFQYFLFKALGIQLSFIDPEYYDPALSISYRMRGFYLEPNWHGIILAFNSLLLFNKSPDWWKKHKVLFLFTLVCLILNGSYTFIGVTVISFIIIFFEKLPKVSINATKIFLLIALLGIFMFFSRSLIKTNSEKSKVKSSIALNYGSRLFPAVKTILFLNDQTFFTKLFGFGLGSWAEIGISKNLGYKSFNWVRTKVSSDQRDSAEFQVFLLEFGWVGVILYLFDGIYLGIKFRMKNIAFFIAISFYVATFFVYPIFKFQMYLVPFYLFRANVLKKQL